ncbi:PRC-barrel domain-containing protein [Methanobrevibacter curvatus]|uniref:PRC-barrel domain protein n=1 Tax=Methanobrevibacter curvatus TaxID=49547 RepID=A0A166ERY9_9EURY|nr:PRC-barrel domain-containing protein [Methanobrevibacter curvatus]KZX16944.1 PRC-barrel domain protein [Methanobrevibacter curvatus]
MVDISKLNNISIYTLSGQYIGKINDIYINMKNGTISKLRVKAIEDTDEKNVGLRSLIGGIIVNDEEEQQPKSYKKDFVTVEYSKVRAVGDIILIDAGHTENPNQTSEVPLQ